MVYSVILSGGVGSRLWPVSRKMHPKPFIKMANGLSILQHTFLRALSLDPQGILHVTRADFLFKVKQEWTELPCPSPLSQSKNIIPMNYLLEPFGRNTAAAIAMASLWIEENQGGDTVLLVLPSDHLVTDQPAFQSAVSEASKLASLEDKIVTFGIKPTSPQIGYGYIQHNGSKVERFVEKPSLDKAKSYLLSGDYLWNAGLFCFKASVMLQEMALHCPDILANSKTCFHASKNKIHPSDILRVEPDTFRAVREDSIDFAVMEKSDKIALVSCDIGWNDVGTWNALSDALVGDENGNVISPGVITEKVNNCYIESDKRLIAAIGINNLVIIDTPDALLVTHKDNSQDVKNIYNQLAEAGHQSHEVHTTVHRPWGSYTVLEETANFKIKRICVHPRSSLSLQVHQHRSEHWVVISGCAQVINGEKNLLLHMNQSTYIPAGNKHRLSNLSDSENLVIIEVQVGSYLGEDDIQRFEDIYGRCKQNA